MSKLRTLRKTRKLTLEEVAEGIGTDAGNLSRIERGLQAPGSELAIKIHDFYRGRIPLREILQSRVN